MHLGEEVKISSLPRGQTIRLLFRHSLCSSTALTPIPVFVYVLVYGMTLPFSKSTLHLASHSIAASL